MQAECYPSQNIHQNFPPKFSCPYPLFTLFLLFSVGSLDDVVIVVIAVAVAVVVAVAVAVVVVVVVPISTLTSATIPLSMGVFKVSP